MKFEGLRTVHEYGVPLGTLAISSLAFLFKGFHMKTLKVSEIYWF